MVEFPWRSGREKGCALLMQDGSGKVFAKTDAATLWSPDGKSDWQPAADCGPHDPDNRARDARGSNYVIRDK